MGGGKRKQRVLQHVMEDESIKIIGKALPTEWVVRPYRPDYGLDLAIETFRRIEDESDSFETLGEHFFVQAKSTKSLHVREVKVVPRFNVAKFALTTRPLSDEHFRIQVIDLPIDTSLLTTVQAMGACAIVFLFVVALDESRVFFVCLNDYVDKVLLPENPTYFHQETVSIRIPLKNEIGPTESLRRNLALIKFHAKRPKFYAAFNLFAYQARELEFVEELEPLQLLVSHFLDVIYRLDIWDSSSWSRLYVLSKWLLYLKATINRPPDRNWFANHPATRYNLEAIDEFDEMEWMYIEDIRSFWRFLTGLGRYYEEICREWYLPTYLAETLRN